VAVGESVTVGVKVAVADGGGAVGDIVTVGVKVAVADGGGAVGDIVTVGVKVAVADGGGAVGESFFLQAQGPTVKARTPMDRRMYLSMMTPEGGWRCGANYTINSLLFV
jgi:hypothetical protein